MYPEVTNPVVRMTPWVTRRFALDNLRPGERSLQMIQHLDETDVEPCLFGSDLATTSSVTPWFLLQVDDGDSVSKPLVDLSNPPADFVVLVVDFQEIDDIQVIREDALVKVCGSRVEMNPLPCLKWCVLETE